MSTVYVVPFLLAAIYMSFCHSVIVSFQSLFLAVLVDNELIFGMCLYIDKLEIKVVAVCHIQIRPIFSEVVDHMTLKIKKNIMIHI